MKRHGYNPMLADVLALMSDVATRLRGFRIRRAEDWRQGFAETAANRDRMTCASLEDKIAPRTARHVDSVLNACLGTALLSGLTIANPMQKVIRIPRVR
jgi:hypothetical protein